MTGCADQQEKYCDAVKDHQQELGEMLGDGSPDALLKALPIFRDLADEAPEDLRDEWKTVIDAVAGLQEALEDAGVDPATYDRDHPPGGLSQADQEAIDAAAGQLTSEETVTAFSGCRPAGQGRVRDTPADRMTGVGRASLAALVNCRACTYVAMLSHAPSQLVALKDPGPWLCPRSLPNSERRPSRRPRHLDGNAPR